MIYSYRRFFIEQEPVSMQIWIYLHFCVRTWIPDNCGGQSDNVFLQTSGYFDDNLNLSIKTIRLKFSVRILIAATAPWESYYGFSHKLIVNYNLAVVYNWMAIQFVATPPSGSSEEFQPFLSPGGNGRSLGHERSSQISREKDWRKGDKIIEF